jgi:hypothetical protein
LHQKLLLQVLNGLIVKIKWKFAVQLKLFAMRTFLFLCSLNSFFLSSFISQLLPLHMIHNITQLHLHSTCGLNDCCYQFSSFFSHVAWGMKKRHKGISDLYFSFRMHEYDKNFISGHVAYYSHRKLLMRQLLHIFWIFFNWFLVILVALVLSYF